MTQQWHQHAATAERTSSVSVLPATGWTASWQLGPDSSGAVASGWDGDTPEQAYPVCGGGRIYRPVGADGLNCRDLADGSNEWTSTAATFNGPPAYDPRLDVVLAGGANGTLYRLDAATGATQNSVSLGSAINTAIAIKGNYAYATCADGSAHKVKISTMAVIWSYDGGASADEVSSHPAVATVDGVTKLVYATNDGYVHAVNDADGSASWRVAPYTDTWTADHSFIHSWPVVATQHGIVLIRCQLPQVAGGGALSAGPVSGDWPDDDAEGTCDTIRTWLEGSGAAYENVFARNFSDGDKSCTVAIGYCSTEDYVAAQAYGVMGMQPVVVQHANGDEVVYLQARSDAVAADNGWDYRWTGVMSEVVLDNSTISGLEAGDWRFVRMGNGFSGGTGYIRIADESCPLVYAGGALLHAHWAGSEHVQIADRGDSLGLTHTSPIDTDELPVIIRANGTGGTFNTTTKTTTSGTAITSRFYDNGLTRYAVFRVSAEPPGVNNPDSGTYSAGMLPRLTFVHEDKLVVVGNGGDLFVMTHSGTVEDAPGISSVADNRADYASSQPGAWDKVQVTASITTVATNNFFFYDANTPDGITPGIGISVDCHFSDDDFVTWESVPMVDERVMDEATVSGQDWIYPTSTYRWMCNYAPPNAGTWNYRISATDANGTTISSVSSDLTVIASANKGHVRVSATDTRYFDYADGTYFPTLGYNASETGDNNANITSIDQDDGESGNATFFGALSANLNVSTLRHFMSTWSIWGMNSNIWRTRDSSDRDALEMLANLGVSPDTEYPTEACWELLNGTQGRRTIFMGWLKRNIAVKANTYLRWRVRLHIGTTLVSNGGSNPGVVIVRHNSWVDNPWASGGTLLTDAVTGGGTVVARLTNTGGGYATLEAFDQIGSSERWLGGTGGGGGSGYVYIVIRNCDTGSGGQSVQIVNIKVDEVDSSGNVIVEDILTKGSPDMHLYVDHFRARVFDRMLAEAEDNDVHLKLTLIDKGDTLLNCIDPATGDIEAEDLTRTNIYGGAGGEDDLSIGRARWLYQCWWRYVQGRWGYSKAIHSWELMNEAANFDGNHAALARIMGDYLGPKVGQFGNPHPVSTSMTNSYPRVVWNDAGVSDPDGGLDFSDLHHYAQHPTRFTGDKTERFDLIGYDASNAVSATIQTDDPNSDFWDVVQHTGRLNGLIGRGGTYDLAAGPVWLGEYGLYGEPDSGANTTDAHSSDLDDDTDLVWLRKLLWSQLHHGGLITACSWWYSSVHFYDRSDGSPNNLSKFKPFADFLALLPDLNSGEYEAASATLPHSDLRAVGQKDTTNGRVHLWIDHKSNRWKDVVDGTSVTGRSGDVTVGSMPNGTYDVTWWDTSDGSSSTTTATASGGTLTLPLPSAISTDIAVLATLQTGAVTGTVAITLAALGLASSGQGELMPSITNAARSAAADGVVDLTDAGDSAGQIRIYAGSVPADVNASLGAATLLATLTFSDPAFGGASNGVATANSITADSSADATGTATFFRKGSVNSGTFTPILQGTVGTSGADMNLNTTSIVSGAAVSITSMTVTMPAS